ncbi:hypothetical protein I4U23_016055 [Adineta vaga]|nr:hypothetical protein I4U23_016055 [Adineta vaga]
MSHIFRHPTTSGRIPVPRIPTLSDKFLSGPTKSDVFPRRIRRDPTVGLFALANLYMTNTTISASLTTDNPKYTRFNGTGSNYFYDQYSIIVPVTGSYIFMSISSIDTFCQFYGPRAYARYYTTIAYNNNDGDENQFKIQMYLQESTRYIMRVTTYNQNIVGDYRILASGLTTVNIEKTVDSSLPSLNHSPRTIGKKSF